jgi:hypothetical protein
MYRNRNQLQWAMSNPRPSVDSVDLRPRFHLLAIDRPGRADSSCPPKIPSPVTATRPRRILILWTSDRRLLSPEHPYEITRVRVVYGSAFCQKTSKLYECAWYIPQVGDQETSSWPHTPFLTVTTYSPHFSHMPKGLQAWNQPIKQFISTGHLSMTMQILGNKQPPVRVKETFMVVEESKGHRVVCLKSLTWRIFVHGLALFWFRPYIQHCRPIALIVMIC